MAHYALINKDNNVVEKVITGVDEDVTQTDLDGTVVGGSTEAWEEFYEKLPWHLGLYCKRTSRSGSIRKQFAGIDWIYDAENDVFIAPQPYGSWTLDDNFDWQPPTPKPNNGKIYEWFEQSRKWIELD